MLVVEPSGQYARNMISKNRKTWPKIFAKKEVTGVLAIRIKEQGSDRRGGIAVVTMASHKRT